MLTSNYVDVEMEDGLAALGTFVDDSTVALLRQTLLGCDFGYDDQQMTQKSSMPVLSLAYACQTITVFGNDEEVFGSHWCDILKSQALIILEDDVGGDLLTNDFIKNGVFYGFTATCCIRHFNYF